MNFELTVGLALWIWGIAALFDEGMLLETLGDMMQKELGHWICKPLFSCPICMSSFHSLLLAGILLLVGEPLSFPEWVYLAISTCGLNFIITKLLSR
jgi:hypothetical protein